MKDFLSKTVSCIVAAIIAFLMCECTSKKDEASKIGEYVYIDRYNCIHINRKCINLIASGLEDEEPHYMVYRVNVEKIREIGNTCSFCVSDEAYKELERIASGR